MDVKPRADGEFTDEEIGHIISLTTALLAKQHEKRLGMICGLTDGYRFQYFRVLRKPNGGGATVDASRTFTGYGGWQVSEKWCCGVVVRICILFQIYFIGITQSVKVLQMVFIGMTQHSFLQFGYFFVADIVRTRQCSIGQLTTHVQGAPSGWVAAEQSAGQRSNVHCVQCEFH